MIRALPVCAALGVLLFIGRTDGGEPTETVIRLTVPPAAEPRPALRYQLLPDLTEMEPGNAIQGYMKTFAEQHNVFVNKESRERQEKWLSMPLKDLPLKEIRNYGGVALRQADYAARLEQADWQMLIPLRRDGLYLLIPDVAQMRTLANVLRVRLRAEIAERRFADATATVKTLLAMSRHLGEAPTLIADLVGVAIAVATFHALDELIEQPGSPNLYWALTNLPHPVVDLRKGLQGERVFLEAELRPIDERAPMSEAQMQQVVKRAQVLHEVGQEGKKDKVNLAAWITERAGNPAEVNAARKRLVESGLAAETLQRFPALQILLLDEKVSCLVRRDAAQKVMPLPYWRAKTLLTAEPVAKPDEKTLYADLIPAYLKVWEAATRLDQRVALLRCVEGLRLYAAAHDGKLPAKLADVPVPLPVDPVTGQPFVYSIEGETATVRGTAPAGLEKSASFNVRYEIKIAK
jgi:hypothetical protein